MINGRYGICDLAVKIKVRTVQLSGQKVLILLNVSTNSGGPGLITNGKADLGLIYSYTYMRQIATLKQ